MPAGATEITWGTSSDGVHLKGDLFLPTGSPLSAWLLMHGGGFVSGDKGSGQLCGQFAQANGHVALSINYRLACPGGIAGQAPCPRVGGRFPDQELDLRRACRYLRATYPGIKIFGIGGSAGGCQMLMLAFDTVLAGTVLDPWSLSDRPDAIYCLSPVTDMTDRAPFFNLAAFRRGCAYYTGVPLPPNDSDPASLLIELNASPVHFATSNGKHTRLFRSTEDTMPFTQNTLMMAALTAAGFTDFREDIITPVDHILVHAFDYWPVIQDMVLADIQNVIAGGGGAPPPMPDIIKGASIGTPDRQPIDAALLADPNVDGIGLNDHWFNLETAENTYDFTYLDGQIRRAAAAGKKVTIRVSSMAGSASLGGNTPDWLFTVIGATAAGNPSAVPDGVTHGTATIDSATADFTSADLHSHITGTDIPANTYLGTILSTTSAKLSSSPTSQVDVNASGSHTACAWIILNRPRVSATTHNVVPGQNFDYQDPNEHHQGDPQTTIPVFWNPVYLAKKRRMINALGNHINNGNTLTPAEKAAVTVFAVSFANAQTEDWNIPADGTVDPGKTLSRLALWLNSPTDPVYANRGAGYTTQLMIDAATKRANENLTDGQIFSNKRLVSASANWTLADVGKVVQGAIPGGIVDGSRIASWTSPTEVQLDTNTLVTTTGLGFQIRFRDTGLFDVAIAAFSSQFVTSAINENDPLLDKAAADSAGDPDSANFLARSVTTAVNQKYPSRIITQKNNFRANTKAAPGGNSDGSLKLLAEIHDGGNYVAGQDIWFCFQDPTFRMNGGTNEDHDNPGEFLSDEQISERAGQRLFTYGASYREMYARDGVNLPDAVKFTHDLFNGIETGPPPPPPVRAPFHAAIRLVDQCDAMAEIAGLLETDAPDISPAIAKIWIASFNRHVRFAWEFWRWPEFFITEERPFRRIWMSHQVYLDATEVFYIPTYSYFSANGNLPAGVVPGFDASWTPLTLASGDRYIEISQTCRQAIGEPDAVFPSNPYLNTSCPRTLDFAVNERGINVPWGGGPTVFLCYKIRPSRFTSELRNPAKGYKTGSLIYSPDLCNTYRAIQDAGPGIGPEAPNGASFWVQVPLPYVLSEYVVNRVAADQAGDQVAKNDFKNDAELCLQRETDKTIEQGMRQSYKLFSPARSWPSFPLLADSSTIPDVTLRTLTESCVDAFGD